MTSITFAIEGPPKGKSRPRFSRRQGIAFTDAQTRNLEAYIKVRAREEMNGQEPFVGPVRLRMQAQFAIPQSASKKRRDAMLRGEEQPCKTPDLDNVVKAVLDGINHVVVVDDKQVTEIIASKRYALTPETIVTVEEIEAA